MTDTKTVHVRFAPSPTGELHLGGARTALFNWLYARHHGGQFHLRIEDTDQLRSQPEFTVQILEALQWLGLDWDGPLVYQSERLSIYKQAVNQLLQSGQAYRCFCSKAELESERAAAPQGREFMYSGKCRDLIDTEVRTRLNQGQNFTVRLHIPKGETVYDDLIYGPVTVNNTEIDDFIIARSDGTPVYNLVVTVDDQDMGITHVIRGEDHISNTSKQILLYHALGYDLPQFGHLPMILGPDKKRLSKRHGAPGVQAFHQAGYPPEALLNYLVLLGWNPDTDDEIFKLRELVDKFQLRQVHKKGAVYDPKKLDWISGKHLLAMSEEEILAGIRVIEPEWRRGRPDEFNHRVIEQLKPRSKSLQDLMVNSVYFYEAPADYDEKGVRKRWKDQSVNELVSRYVVRLESLIEWSSENAEWLLRETATEATVSAGKLIHPVRLALTGVVAGPSLFAIMELLGQDACLRRLKLALEKLP